MASGRHRFEGGPEGLRSCSAQARRVGPTRSARGLLSVCVGALYVAEGWGCGWMLEGRVPRRGAARVSVTWGLLGDACAPERRR